MSTPGRDRCLPGLSGLKATLNSAVSPGSTAPESRLRLKPVGGGTAPPSAADAADVENGGVGVGCGTQVKYTAAVPRCRKLKDASTVDVEGSVAGRSGEEEEEDGAEVVSCSWVCESSRCGPGCGPAAATASASACCRACSSASKAR